jgi:hypothetical protein
MLQARHAELLGVSHLGDQPRSLKLRPSWGAEPALMSTSAGGAVGAWTRTRCWGSRLDLVAELPK